VCSFQYFSGLVNAKGDPAAVGSGIDQTIDISRTRSKNVLILGISYLIDAH
jgi:hypothetical protein